MSTHNLEQLIYDISSALLVPVLILALLALAATLVETGSVVVEMWRRRGRSFRRLDVAAGEARAALAEDDADTARAALRPFARSVRMATALDALVGFAGEPGGADRAAKTLADFDYASLKRLERTRLLVRAGPALGLMGTLIPLSPALAALSEGDTQKLADNLRIAFSVTVLGLLVGAVAFGISLVRDRIYGQDLSDLDYVTAVLIEEQAAVLAEDRA